MPESGGLFQHFWIWNEGIAQLFSQSLTLGCNCSEVILQCLNHGAGSSEVILRAAGSFLFSIHTTTRQFLLGLELLFILLRAGRKFCLLAFDR